MSDPGTIEEPEVFWTVSVRGRAQTHARPIIEEQPAPKPPPHPLLFGQPPAPAPAPPARRFLVRWRAMTAAIQALIEGAEAVEIFRFPPLQTKTKTPKPDPENGSTTTP